MTPAFPTFGFGALNPSTQTPYTKPILVLTSPRCYSCADFFPGILQWNGRARIFGERTAGAGGVVKIHKFANNLGIDEVLVTESIADFGIRRADGSVVDDPNRAEHPVENLGITPDVPYKWTMRDVADKGAAYARAVNREIVAMMGAVGELCGRGGAGFSGRRMRLAGARDSLRLP